MEVPSIVEDILAEVDYRKYSLALIRWPKLIVRAYWIAAFWTVAVFIPLQQEPQRWGLPFLGGALATLSIALVIRHEVIAARSKADGKKLSGLDEVRSSIRAARRRDVKRLLKEKGYNAEELLKWVVSRLSEKSAYDFKMPAALMTMLSVLLSGFLTAFGYAAGPKNAALFIGVLLFMCLMFHSAWLMHIRPFVEREQRKLMDAHHLLEEVLHEPASLLIEDRARCARSRGWRSLGAE